MTKHLVKHSSFLQKIFIPKHALLILNYQCYHLTQMVSIMNYYFKIYILVKLCAGHYAIVDGLVNGANGTLQDYTKKIQNR
jgi:hypothetical protein